MGIYLLPLLLGFIFNLASAFTATFSRWWGEQRGAWATFILRNILGIPVWALGYALAFGTRSPWLWVPLPMTKVLGWIFLAGGGLIIGVALLAIRARAARPSARNTEEFDLLQRLPDYRPYMTRVPRFLPRLRAR